MARARRALWLLPLGALAIFLPWREGAELTALGDGRPAVLAALADAKVDLPVDVVLLRRLENLRHVPETSALCRGDCEAAATVVVEIRPGGPRKVVVVDLSRFDGVEALDRAETLPEGIATCVADTIRAEGAGLRGEPAPACLPSRRAVWRLPFGL